MAHDPAIGRSDDGDADHRHKDEGGLLLQTVAVTADAAPLLFF